MAVISISDWKKSKIDTDTLVTELELDDGHAAQSDVTIYSVNPVIGIRGSGKLSEKGSKAFIKNAQPAERKFKLEAASMDYLRAVIRSGYEAEEVVRAAGQYASYTPDTQKAVSRGSNVGLHILVADWVTATGEMKTHSICFESEKTIDGNEILQHMDYIISMHVSVFPQDVPA